MTQMQFAGIMKAPREKFPAGVEKYWSHYAEATQSNESAVARCWGKRLKW